MKAPKSASAGRDLFSPCFLRFDVGFDFLDEARDCYQRARDAASGYLVQGLSFGTWRRILAQAIVLVVDKEQSIDRVRVGHDFPK